MLIVFEVCQTYLDQPVVLENGLEPLDAGACFSGEGVGIFRQNDPQIVVGLSDEWAQIFQYFAVRLDSELAVVWELRKFLVDLSDQLGRDTLDVAEVLPLVSTWILFQGLESVAILLAGFEEVPFLQLEPIEAVISQFFNQFQDVFEDHHIQLANRFLVR